MSKNKYWITNHAIDRFQERFSHVYNTEGMDKLPLIDYLLNLIKESTENKSFANNTEFMLYVQEKYGYSKYTFLCNNNIIFVIKDNKVITIMHKTWLPVVIKQKYTKKVKRNIHAEELELLDPKILFSKEFENTIKTL